MIKKIVTVTVICIIVFLIAVWLNLKKKNITFKKKYMEKMSVSDYRGAIDVAKEWKKSTNYGPSYFALANAYALNFEPSKAVSEVMNYIADMELHSLYSKKSVARGYAALAYFDCEAGSYKLSHQNYQKAEELYPEIYKKTLTQRYVCKMHELASSSTVDQKRRASFKKEISEYIEKAHDEREDVFNKAILALVIADDKQQALKFAKIGLEYTERRAKEILGDRTKIPAYTKAKMAMFYALNGDMQSANRILSCATNCNADYLLRQGNDSYWLAHYFASINDAESVDECLKFLWQRMVTAEQKKYFFKFTIQNQSVEGAWIPAVKLDWIKTEYSKFKSAQIIQ
jgi:hypothetical protein